MTLELMCRNNVKNILEIIISNNYTYNCIIIVVTVIVVILYCYLLKYLIKYDLNILVVLKNI